MRRAAFFDLHAPPRQWFEVTSHDVEFRAEFEDAAGACLVAWPQGRFKAGARHKGTFVAHAAGTVHCRWSNSYSRFRGKTVRFASHVSCDKLVPGGAVVVRLQGAAGGEDEEDPHGVLVPPLDPAEEAGDTVQVVLSDASTCTVPRHALRPAAADFFEQGNAKLVAGGALFFPGRFCRAVDFYESGARRQPPGACEPSSLTPRPRVPRLQRPTSTPTCATRPGCLPGSVPCWPANRLPWRRPPPPSTAAAPAWRRTTAPTVSSPT